MGNISGEMNTTRQTSSQSHGIPGKVHYWLVSILVLAVPLCFDLPGRAKALPLAALFILGIVAVIRDASVRGAIVGAWPVFAVCLLMPIYAAANIIVHHLPWGNFDLPAQVLLFIFVAAALAKPFKTRATYIGFSLAALFYGAISIAQHFIFGEARPHGINGGSWVAIEFAMLQCTLALFAFAHVLRPAPSRMETLLHVAAFLIGASGGLLTLSRGPIFAFIVILVAMIMVYITKHQKHRVLNVVWCGLILIAIIAALTMQRDMRNRLLRIPTAISNYFNHDVKTGSIQQRLEMWRTAWRGFTEHPVFGVGLEQFKVYSHEQIAAGNTAKSIAQYRYPHSEILNAAVTGGIFGLIAILLLMLVPLAYFAKRIRGSPAISSQAAVLGVIVVVNYLLCGLTDVVLYRAMPHSLYFFAILSLAILIAKNEQSMGSNAH